MPKQNKTIAVSRLAIAIGLVIACFASMGGSIEALARSYITDDQSIKTGMVVATIGQSDDAGEEGSLVQKATQANAELAVGIVTDVGASDMSYSENVEDEVLVESTGQVRAYVSDVNGSPKAGDLLVPSPLEGILMRADKSTNGIIGAAAGDFPDTATDYELQDGGTAKIAIIAVNMDIHPVNAQPANMMQDLASRIVGHDVSLVQTLIAAAIFLLTIVVVGGMMHSAIASYISSIGRNPLGKNILRRGLVRIFALVIVVLCVGMLVSWVVLWL